MKKMAVTLVSLLAATSLAACGSTETPKETTSAAPAATAAATTAPAKTDAKPVKLRIYAQYADEDTKTPYDYAVAELKKEMPNVELELDIQAQDDGQKLKTYAATGNLPDIFQAGLDIIDTFKKSNNILMLDEYVTKFGFKDKMQPSAMNTLVTDDGHTYAFPYAGNEVALLYYNKDLFQQNGVKVPTTYDEMMTAVKTFNGKGITPLSIFAKEKWPCVALYDMFVTRADAGGINKLDKGTAKAEDAAYKTAADKIIELVKAGMLPKGATNLNYDQAAALYHEGKAAMFINGQWEIEAATKALGDKAGYMYLPAADAAAYEKGKTAFSGSGGPGGYAVSANTKDKELAAKVASFISLKYAEYKYTNRSNPIVATKVDKPIVKQFPPMMDQLSKDIPKITSTTAFSWGLSNPKFKAALEDATQNLMTGNYTSDQFVKDLNKAAVPAK
ncbi:extracellular solute-binding protein [Paenibacillus qinlingensis]|uniref:Raffinose/stachyose/melibiose transport system substrate-binding protein n=1 Tax=Paenibacillus qinlingensis TaxID=1837343 RepID=A0ABU1NV39_9BACL|nr:extracellular solute-binding protein [Paenibacillus qinlingensis]MDR6551194.1 raffinose/stachyose/melibiose transport system substrate-binding protein [Paenibacillus qinlingensis]